MAGVKHTVSIELQESLATGLELYGTDGIRLSSDVLAIYHFDNNANDATGDYNLIETGGPTYDSVNEKLGTHAIDLDGLAQYATQETLLDVTPDGIAIEGWFWLDSTFDVSDETTLMMLEKANTDGEDRIKVFLEDGALNLLTEENNNGTAKILSTTVSWSAETWYHFVANWATDVGMELWVNGSREVNDAAKTTLMANGTQRDFAVGVQLEGGGTVSFFPGKFDEFIVYNRALTSTEIAARYNAGNGAVLPQYSTNSPATTAGWTALDKGELDVSTALCVVYKDGYEDGEVQAESSTGVKVRYYANGGGASGWMTIAVFKALSDIEITDTTSSFKMEAQYNSDGSYESASRAQVMIDFTPSVTGVAGNQVF